MFYSFNVSNLMDEQLQRIRKMERHLNRASAALKRLSSALDKYDEAKAEQGKLYSKIAWRTLGGRHLEPARSTPRTAGKNEGLR